MTPRVKVRLQHKHIGSPSSVPSLVMSHFPVSYDFHVQASFRTQCRALFYKNAAFQWNNRRTNIRLVLTPIGTVFSP